MQASADFVFGMELTNRCQNDARFHYLYKLVGAAAGCEFMVDTNGCKEMQLLCGTPIMQASGSARHIRSGIHDIEIATED
jgi:hypothetical protein